MVTTPHSRQSQPTHALVSPSSVTDQKGRFQYAEWILTETIFDPTVLGQRETVFTIGNGYVGTRGNFEEGYDQSLPVTLIHGVYDNVPVLYTELANCPDWLSLVILIDGERFQMNEGEILRYERRLDLYRGNLLRTVEWRSPQGKVLKFQFERFASLSNEHVLGLRCQITPLTAVGEIEVRTSLNGYPANQGFNHWNIINQGHQDGQIWLHTRTRSTGVDLAMAAQLQVKGVEAISQTVILPGFPTLTKRFKAHPQQTVTLEKRITVYSSHDIEHPGATAQAQLLALADYDTLKQEHEAAWAQVWQDSDVVIEGDVRAQFALRYNLFQLLISAAQHNERVSIPAKTLSGYGYRGHVFWDTELFILPFFTYTQSHLARNLLTYRYHTLAGARRKAQHYGYKGAMFAWESAATGDEVTPRWAVPGDPYGQDVRIWCRDRAIHISADIAYAIWHYWRATGDDDWMRRYGAEIILDGALFWISRVTLNTKHERYEILEVVGPDEYHEKVDNNAYTNRMVQWHLEKAIVVYDWLRETDPAAAESLEQRLGITQKQRSRWQDIVDHLWIPFDETTGLIEQFEGFFSLQDINLADYEPRHQSMHSVLGIEAANHQQVLKQPDVLMLMYLLRESQAFPYRLDLLERNWHYYAPRTDITYGSSLGPAIHAILAADLDHREEAYTRFMQAALVDLEDVRGNAKEGIHGASAGSVWQAAILGFGGIQFTDQGPVAHPHLPEGWTRLKFRLQWRGKWYSFDLRPHGNAIAEPPESLAPACTIKCPDIQAVIFDLDGVLTDTAEYHYRAWQRLADELGIPFNRAINESLRGVSRRDSLLKILGDRTHSEAELAEMMDRKNRYYVELIEQVSPQDLLPGVVALLDDLQRSGIKIAVGSASKNARSVLEQLGIADRMDAIADGHSVTQSKPAPDLFLHAAEQLRVAPEHCLVVEDATSGIAAALSAGMWSLGIGPQERVGAAHAILPNLAGTSLNSVIEALTEESTEAK
jgi:beta-phosphoglucomutase